MTPDSQGRKPEFSYDELRGIDMVAKQIDAMPSGPAKEYAKSQFARAHSQLLQSYDMPVQAIAPDQYALKAVDYGSGLLRTGVGEAARAGKAAVDAANHVPSTWTPGSAVDAFKSAANPFNGQPAKSSSAYMEELGVPSGPSVNVPLLGDVSARGAGGFLMDGAITPRNLEKGAGLARGVAPPVPLVDQPLPQQMELPIDGAVRQSPQTAKTLRTVDELTRTAADSEGAQPFFTVQRGQDFLSGLKDLATDPADAIAKKLHDFRFRHADEAAAMRGKVLPSDVMWEERKINGAPGITSDGIRADMQKVLTRNENDINDFAKDAADSGTMPVARRGTLHNTPEQLKGTALHGLLGPDQMAAEQDMVGGAAAKAARNGILNDVRQVEGGKPLRPAHEQDFTNYDPLNHDRPVQWDEMNQIRQNAQAEAKARNWYSNRKDMLQAPLPGDAKKIAEEAATYSRWGNAAGNAADDMLDEAQPGAGAAAYLRRKDMGALLEGGGWLDRSPVKGATTRSQIAFAPIEGRMMHMGTQGMNTAAMAASQALSSPWSRYVALPAARAGWLNYDEQKRNAPTYDESGAPGGDNPWAMIYKYGAKQ